MRCHIVGILVTCDRLYHNKCGEIVKTNEKNARSGGGVGAGRWGERRYHPLPRSSTSYFCLASFLISLLSERLLAQASVLQAN